jgi:hypothetical protein
MQTELLAEIAQRSYGLRRTTPGNVKHASSQSKSDAAVDGPRVDGVDGSEECFDDFDSLRSWDELDSLRTLIWEELPC